MRNGSEGVCDQPIAYLQKHEGDSVHGFDTLCHNHIPHLSGEEEGAQCIYRERSIL